MIAGSQPDHRLGCKQLFVQTQVCVVSKIIFVLAIDSEPPQSQTRHFRCFDFTLGCLRWNEKERIGKRQQPDVLSFYSTYLLQNLYHLFSRDILVHRPFTLLLNTAQARTASWPRFIFVFLLRSHLITQVSVRSCVCGISTLESWLQTGGVWSRVLAEFSSLSRGLYFYVLGLPHFKNRLRLDDRPACGPVWVEPEPSRTQIMVKCQQCLCVRSSC